MAISKVGLGWPVGERNYTTLADWIAALKASGSYEEAWCSGSLGASFATIAAADFAQGALIKGDITYNGANQALLPKLSRKIEIFSTAMVVAQDIYIQHGDSTQYAVVLGASNKIMRCFVEHTSASVGTSAGALSVTATSIAENCIACCPNSITSRVIRPTSNGVVKNCVAFGALYAIQTEWTSTKTEKCYAGNSNSSNYVWNNGKPALNNNNASSDSTGDTGFQNLPVLSTFVDFTNGDYRIRSSSLLHAAGIGAFFESTSSIQLESNSRSVSAAASALETAITFASVGYSTSQTVSDLVAGAINFASNASSTSRAQSAFFTQITFASLANSYSRSQSDLGSDAPTFASIAYSASRAISELNTTITFATVARSTSISYSNLTEQTVARYLERWDGLNFNQHALKRWNGTQYVVNPLKRWNGTEWVQYNG